jgi:hypothetical protein
VVAVIGGPGSGKSTLAAALRRPPGDDVPLAVVQAVAFVATAAAVPELARALRGQLDRLPHFPAAAGRYQRANSARWDALDVWQQQVTGPLSVYLYPVRLLIDGLDQLDGRPEQLAVTRALTELITQPGLGHVCLLVTGRTRPALPGIDAELPMPGLDPATAHRYLAGRHLGSEVEQRLVELAAGSWLVLTLATDLASRTGTLVPDTLDQLYTDLINRVRTSYGEQAGPVFGVLAAAGPGPVLPFEVLTGAVGRLGGAQPRAALHAVLGDPDLYPVLDRTRPGRDDEHLGLFHQTLVDHILAHADAREAHQAIADTLDQLAPADRHDPKSYRSDPLLTYAFDAGPRHRWGAGQPERLVKELAERADPVPRVNLARWTSWAGPIQEQPRPGPPRHPDHPQQRRRLDRAGRRRRRGAAAVPRAAARPGAGARPGPPRHPDHPQQRRLLDRAGRRRRRGAAAVPRAAARPRAWPSRVLDLLG